MTTKDDYIRKMHSALDQLSNEIDSLRARTEQVEETGRAEFSKRMDELRLLRDDAQEHMKNLQAAGESAWGDMKAGAEIAWDAIAQAIDSARKRFK